MKADLLHANDEGGPRTDRAFAAFDSLSLPIAIFDRDYRFVQTNAAHADMVSRESADLKGQTLFAAFPDTAERMDVVRTAMQACFDGHRTQLEDLVYQIPAADGTMVEKVWSVINDPVFDAQGYVSHIIQRAEDVTKAHQLERRNKAITYEINHRVKNIMAVVTAIARISSRNASSVSQFLENFTGRIESMRRIHERLNADNWQGLSLRETLEAEMGPFIDKGTLRYELSGPDVSLSVSGAKDITLVVHELLTNAAKHGALRSDGGQLSIRWETHDTGVTITWTERPVEAVDIAAAPGFGTRLFGMLPSIEVDSDLRGDGLVATIRLSGDDSFA